MRAIIYKRYGGPDVLELAEVATPRAGDDEVSIQVQAAEATKADCELRSFNFPVKWFTFGLRLVFGVFRPRKKILGGYFSGTIDAVGRNVRKFVPGDEVYGVCRMRMGAYAQYLVLPDKYPIVHKPANLSFEEAAAVPLGGLNALHFLRLADVKQGEKVLVDGAGGSIGIFGVQIAKSMGAEVTAVDKAAKGAFLRAMGIDHFIDYEQQDFRDAEYKYDVIFDMVAASPLEETVAALRDGGRYVTANPTFRKMTRAGKVLKETGKRVIFAFAAEQEEELLALKAMIEEGKIRSVVDKVFPMTEAAAAHRRVETERREGIVVIRMDM